MNFQHPNPKAQIPTVLATKGTKNVCTVILFAVLSGVPVFAGFVANAGAQQVLDRIVARVGTSAITQTDVEAAVAFGVVDKGDAMTQVIERRLILGEVNRFPPPEPAEAAIAELVGKMRSTAGPDAAAVMTRTGVDDKRLAELARDTLRIQSYIQQRFGSSARGEQQLARWLSDLRDRGDVTVTELSPRQ
jgi:hypothetical protein